LSLVCPHVSVAWPWAVLGVCLFLILVLLIRARSLRRQLRCLEVAHRVPETSGSDDVEAIPADSDVERSEGARPSGERTERQEEKRHSFSGKDPERRGALVQEEESEERFLLRLKARIVKTQGQLVGRLDQILFGKGALTLDVLEELEEVLVTADLGVKTSHELLREIQKALGKEQATPEQVREALKQRIGALLSVGAGGLDPDICSPFVIMLVGVNGVGKTTTAGKLASYLGHGDRKMMLVAADTFRPAAIEQLQTWSERVGADFIRHQPGADPSAVVFDAMRAAKSRKSDVVLVDTAGRLHTKKNLMEELKKVKKIMGRELSGAPHEILLVLDATTGQNAIQQARIFHESLGVTGLVLTKLDGTAKGGMIVGVSNELQIPVRFIGIGEQTQDLQEFKPQMFLDAMFGENVSRSHGPLNGVPCERGAHVSR